jgi:hypothetical protein
LCAYRGETLELRNDLVDKAVQNYFGSSGQSTKLGGGNADARPQSNPGNAQATFERHDKTIVLPTLAASRPETRMKPSPTSQRASIPQMPPDAEQNSLRSPSTT